MFDQSWRACLHLISPLQNRNTYGADKNPIAWTFNLNKRKNLSFADTLWPVLFYLGHALFVFAVWKTLNGLYMQLERQQGVQNTHRCSIFTASGSDSLSFFWSCSLSIFLSACPHYDLSQGQLAITYPSQFVVYFFTESCCPRHLDQLSSCLPCFTANLSLNT